MNYIPGLGLILLISMVIALVTHLWRGGNLLRLVMLMIFSFLGFIVGQWMGNAFQSKFFLVGWVQMGWGSIIAILTSVVGAWLTEMKKQE